MDSLRKKNIIKEPTPSQTSKAYREKKKSKLRIVEDVKETARTKKSFRIKRFFLFLFLILFSVSLLYTILVTWKIHSLSKNISISNVNSSFARDLASTAFNFLTESRKKLKGENEGRINILLLGSSGESNPGKNLTDTIMIASIDTQKRKTALLSLPRDLYVEIPNSQSYTKINGLYRYGLSNNQGEDTIKEAIKEVTGLNIHYFLIMDFDGFEKAIDALGGINVDVERDIYDPRYPGPNYSYETFELKKGFQALDGKTALKYVRERHNDPEGDFGRAKRQQQVMQSVKNKIFSLKTALNPAKISELLSVIENNIKTDMAFDDIESFAILSRNLDTQNVTTRVVDAWKSDSLLKVSHVFYDNIRIFILIPKTGNYLQIKELAENIFDIEKIEKRKDKIRNEKASVAIINMSGDGSLPRKIKEIIKENLSIENVSLLQSQNGTIHKETILIDNTDKRKLYTLNELTTKLPAKISKNSTNEWDNYDIVVMLGEDLSKIHSFEEDEIENFRNTQENIDFIIKK